MSAEVDEDAVCVGAEEVWVRSVCVEKVSVMVSVEVKRSELVRESALRSEVGCFVPVVVRDEVVVGEV